MIIIEYVWKYDHCNIIIIIITEYVWRFEFCKIILGILNMSGSIMFAKLLSLNMFSRCEFCKIIII